MMVFAESALMPRMKVRPRRKAFSPSGTHFASLMFTCGAMQPDAHSLGVLLECFEWPEAHWLGVEDRGVELRRIVTPEPCHVVRGDAEMLARGLQGTCSEG